MSEPDPAPIFRLEAADAFRALHTLKACRGGEDFVIVLDLERLIDSAEDVLTRAVA